MSRSYRHGSGDLSDLAGGLMVLAVIAAIVTAYILVRIAAFCFHTFRKFPQEKKLWISLAVAVFLSVVGGVLASLTVNAAWANGGVAGLLQLFVTCIVVQRQNATVCLPESMSVKAQILERSWWSDTETPFAA